MERISWLAPPPPGFPYRRCRWRWTGGWGGTQCLCNWAGRQWGSTVPDCPSPPAQRSQRYPSQTGQTQTHLRWEKRQHLHLFLLLPITTQATQLRDSYKHMCRSTVGRTVFSSLDFLVSSDAIVKNIPLSKFMRVMMYPCVMMKFPFYVKGVASLPFFFTLWCKTLSAFSTNLLIIRRHNIVGEASCCLKAVNELEDKWLMTTTSRERKTLRGEDKTHSQSLCLRAQCKKNWIQWSTSLQYQASVDIIMGVSCKICTRVR